MGVLGRQDGRQGQVVLPPGRNEEWEEIEPVEGNQISIAFLFKYTVRPEYLLLGINLSILSC